MRISVFIRIITHHLKLTLEMSKSNGLAMIGYRVIMRSVVNEADWLRYCDKRGRFQLDAGNLREKQPVSVNEVKAH